MYCSPVSPGCCFLVLNCARSKMRFFLIPKCPSNFSMTEMYTVLSTAVISVVSGAYKGKERSTAVYPNINSAAMRGQILPY